MKKIVVSALLLILLLPFFSCKKDSDPQNTYYLTMNIDNKSFSFNDSLFAKKQSSAPQLTIFATGNASGQLQLLLSDYSAGTYADTYDTANKKIIYQFTVHEIVGQSSNGPSTQTLSRPEPTVANAISITIKNVTTTYIEGSFSGALNNGSPTTSNVTNGQFKIPFK